MHGFHTSETPPVPTLGWVLGVVGCFLPSCSVTADVPAGIPADVPAHITAEWGGSRSPAILPALAPSAIAAEAEEPYSGGGSPIPGSADLLLAADIDPAAEFAALGMTVSQDDPRPRRPPRRRRGFSGYGMVSVGIGDFDYDDETLGRDDAGAQLIRLRAGAGNRRGFGGGVDAKLIFPFDDVYEGTINETEFSQADIYLFAQAHISGGLFRMPVRVGPYFHLTSTEFTRTDAETDYSSFGIRAEIEPEIVFLRTRRFDASVFALLSGGAHDSNIDDESTDEEYDSDGSTIGIEAGVRFAAGRFALDASFFYRESTVRESDVERGLVIPRLETEFTGVQLTAGVRF